LNAVRVEKKQPEAEQYPVNRHQIGCMPARPVNDNELLLQKQAVSDNGPRTAGSKEFGDCG